MINVSIFSPHEDKFDFTNRNIIYSQYSKKNKINTTLYVSNFNYKTKKHKKLKNYFYESEVHKQIHIYRIFSLDIINSFSNYFLTKNDKITKT